MNNSDPIRVVLRVIIAIWFVTINLFILIPTAKVLWGSGGGVTPPTQESMNPPAPPNPLALPPLDPKLPLEVQKEQVGSFTQRVNAYTQEVNAYTQRVSAYKTSLDAAAKSNGLEWYKAAVTDTLVPILNGFIVTFLGWVFANLTAGAAERLLESRRRRAEPESRAATLGPIKLL